MSLYDNFNQKDLVDLLKAYDSYISNAAEAGLLTTGWTPVCVEEFYHHEYQNVWDPQKGDASFDYMYEASESYSMEEGPVPATEPNRIYEIEATNGARIFMEAGQLMAQFPDEDEKRHLRSHIQDILDGDAFIVGTGVHHADGDAHQNMDEPDEPWIVYDVGGDSWFIGDIAVADHLYGRQLRESLFVFDVELCLHNKAPDTIDGYLIATDGLVGRLKKQVQIEMPEVDIDSMENINFYAIYDTAHQSIKIETHFWYTDAAGRVQTAAPELSLNEQDASNLRMNLFNYCNECYGKSPSDFVRDTQLEAAHKDVVQNLTNELNNILLDGEYGDFTEACVEIPLSYSSNAGHVLVVWGEESGDENFYSLAIYKANEKNEPQEAVRGMETYSESESFEDLTAAAHELLERFDKLPVVEKAPDPKGLDSIISGAEQRKSDHSSSFDGQRATVAEDKGGVKPDEHKRIPDHRR